MQWLNSTTAEVFIWDEDKWVEMPSGSGGGLWTDNGGGSISYSGNVSVSDGNLSVTSSTDTAIINLNNSIGNYEIANNEFGSIAIKYNGDERFVLASNGNTYLYGQVNAPGATITGDLLAAKADAGANAVAVGTSAGKTTQSEGGVALGAYAGNNTQGYYGIAVGGLAGMTNQGDSAVAVGVNCGESNQGSDSVAIGAKAGQTTQGSRSIAIGPDCASKNQSDDALAIGSGSGYEDQGQFGTAVGRNAGSTTQGESAVAIGYGAGESTQGINATAVGFGAGKSTQGESAVALGRASGMTNQGAYSIAIGREAGKENQAANSIVINSSGVEYNVSVPNSCSIYMGTGKYLEYNGTNAWTFGGGPVNGLNGFRQNGAPVIDAKGLINTLSTLHRATMDETKDIRESLRSAIEELVEGLEQEIATMPAGDSE
jgi:hypothetical protein